MQLSYVGALKNTFFPLLCLSCGNKISHDFLCTSCKEKIRFLRPPLCRYCSAPIAKDKGSLCKKCFGKKFPYQNVISITAYREPIIHLIHLFKYKNCDYLAEYLSSFITDYLSKIGFDASKYHFMTCVPMHKHKLKIRGYNQAELLGQLLSNYFKIAFRNDIIYGINIKPSQTKLTPYKRKENVKGIFAVKKAIKDKRIILIDDIFTTGATAISCCQALREKGAKAITVITLSKTIN